MKYQFILSYQATDSEEVWTNTCHPIYGDDLSVAIDRENGEWYYKRKLDGKITFVRDDYNWIMSQSFDGTFTINILYTNDGTTWLPYFDGTFSRANLEIDEDNQRAILTSLIEGVYNAIENGKDEDYDLMKIIPDADAKEVQGQVHPALAIIDECSSYTKPSFSDIYASTPIISGGYKNDVEMIWASDKNMNINPNGRFQGIFVEAKVVMRNNYMPNLAGTYTGVIDYATHIQHGSPSYPNVYYYINSVSGDLYSQQRELMRLSIYSNTELQSIEAYLQIGLGGTSGIAYIPIGTMGPDDPSAYWYSPIAIHYEGNNSNHIQSIDFIFHYLYSSLLTQSTVGAQANILATGPYYKGIRPFDGSGLYIYASSRTVEQPNGHRLVPGTGEQGTTPQYFAPPDDQNDYIPLAENNWNYGSLWYTITPSVANGLLDETKIGSFRWTRCWTLGTVLRYLLDRITDGKVVFSEDSTSSRFLYDTVNPVNQHEPFDYLITQKTNVMNPGQDNTHESAARCPVRLNWFLELLHNAFNCYYWLEKRNDGKYLFRVEHVEYCRKGGRYDGDLDHSIDITTLKPRRNFRDYANQLRKTYADQTNKYTYNMQNMVEKYTFSWQGDGGSDAFKGNPMFFKSGWIEKSSSEDHQVDNIFADLAWLMLNSGTDTASSKNYDGVFLFSGYRPAVSDQWKENGRAQSQYLTVGQVGYYYIVPVYIWLKALDGQTFTAELVNTSDDSVTTIATYTGTGEKQLIVVTLDMSPTYPFILRLNFGVGYNHIIIHRIHASSGQVYYVPNVTDLLSPSNYLQNGPLAWPWLQNEHLHYDIPANKWSYLYDNLQDVNDNDAWQDNGTVKMIQKQTVNPVPITDKSTEDSIMDITGIHTSIEGGKTGIITNAKVNLSSRNAELTIIYDPVPPQQQ